METKKTYDHNLLYNMQYYMEYCEANGYVTPQKWLDEYKHYSDTKTPIITIDDEIGLYARFIDEFTDFEGQMKPCNGVVIFNWFANKLWGI